MEKLINMIEMEGDEIDEKIIANAYDFAKPDLEKLIDFQKEIIKKAGKEKLVQQEASPDPLLEEAIRGFLKDRLEKAMAEGKGDELKDDLRYFIEGKYPGLNKTKYAWDFLEKETNRVLHENILNKDKRPDGRKLDEIRPIQLEAGLLPRTHGHVRQGRHKGSFDSNFGHTQRRQAVGGHGNQRQKALYAPLQFSALLLGGSQAHERARPTGNRPRHARGKSSVPSGAEF